MEKEGQSIVGRLWAKALDKGTGPNGRARALYRPQSNSQLSTSTMFFSVYGAVASSLANTRQSDPRHWTANESRYLCW